MIQLYTVYKRLTLDPKTQMVKSKRNEKKKKIYHENCDQKTAEVAMLISYKNRL